MAWWGVCRGGASEISPSHCPSRPVLSAFLRLRSCSRPDARLSRRPHPYKITLGAVLYMTVGGGGKTSNTPLDIFLCVPRLPFLCPMTLRRSPEAACLALCLQHTAKKKQTSFQLIADALLSPAAHVRNWAATRQHFGVPSVTSQGVHL